MAAAAACAGAGAGSTRSSTATLERCYTRALLHSNAATLERCYTRTLLARSPRGSTLPRLACTMACGRGARGAGRGLWSGLGAGLQAVKLEQQEKMLQKRASLKKKYSTRTTTMVGDGAEDVELLVLD